MKNKLHEAVCAAAGWPAYCSDCGARMKRVSGLGGGYSTCPNEACKRNKPKPATPYYIQDDEVTKGEG